MASGKPTKWALVLYNVSGRGDNLLWHQRHILGEVASLDGTERTNVFAVLTPDGDVYLEDYSGRLAGVTAIRFAGNRRQLPGGVPSATTYRFKGDIPADELEEAHRFAVEAAEEWWRAQGGRRPANVLLPMEPPPLAPPQGEPPAQQQQPQRQQEGRPDSALNGAPMDSSSDARTLAIRTRADGERLVLSWRDVAERVEEVAAPDWPLNGPRTVTWICRFIERRGGGGPNAYHQW